VKISPEGERLATFSIISVPGMRRQDAWDYAIAPGGKFYFIAGRRVDGKDQIVILRFNGEGALDSTIVLDTVFLPLKVAPFSSGGFLVSGTTLIKKPDELRRPVTAIVDESGRVKPIVLDDDIPAERAARTVAVEENSPKSETGQESKVKDRESGSPTNLINDVGLGAAVSADDGNVYLFRATDSPGVYEIDPSGNVLRRLVLKIPWPGFSPSAYKVANGRIAVDAEAPPDPATNRKDVLRRIAVFNAEDGEFLYAYEIPKEAGALGCFAPHGLTFLGPDNNSLRMVLQFAAF
jgi:hypothetical protein